MMGGCPICGVPAREALGMSRESVQSAAWCDRHDVKRAQSSQVPLFDGRTYTARYDEKRLRTLLGRVFTLMSDGKWRTLWGISHQVHGSESGVSARLRDFRKKRFADEFGVAAVESRRADGVRLERGVWQYRLVLR